MKLKALYMFCDPTADAIKNRAEVDAPACKMFVVGVSSTDEGAKIAKQLVQQEGITLIEVCGAFGYEGAKKVSEAVGDKVPVGMIVHQVWNAARLAKLLESLEGD
jgi:hypothetical protein